MRPRTNYEEHNYDECMMNNNGKWHQFTILLKKIEMEVKVILFWLFST